MIRRFHWVLLGDASYGCLSQRPWTSARLFPLPVKIHFEKSSELSSGFSWGSETGVSFVSFPFNLTPKDDDKPPNCVFNRTCGSNSALIFRYSSSLRTPLSLRFLYSTSLLSHSARSSLALCHRERIITIAPIPPLTNAMSNNELHISEDMSLTSGNNPGWNSFSDSRP